MAEGEKQVSRICPWKLQTLLLINLQSLSYNEEIYGKVKIYVRYFDKMHSAMSIKSEITIDSSHLFIETGFRFNTSVCLEPHGFRIRFQNPNLV